MSTKREKRVVKLTEDYRGLLLTRLKNPLQAIYYLNAVLEEKDDPEVFLIALRDVAEARGMRLTARKAGLNRESFYRMLSKNGNPKIASLYALLSALGFILRVDLRKRKKTIFRRAA